LGRFLTIANSVHGHLSLTLTGALIMRFSLSLIAVIAIASPADAQSFPLKLFGKSKEPAATQSGPLDRQLALARLSERHGQLDQASKIYSKVLSRDPNHLTAHHRLGVVETRRGQLEAATAHFSAAAQIQPPSAELLSDMGYAYYLTGNLTEAESMLSQSLRLNPDNKAACNNLALVLGSQGKLDQSLALFRRAGDEASAHANLGYLQSQMGMLKEAEASFHRALDHDPKLKPAAQALLQVAAHRKAIGAQIARSNSESATVVAQQAQTATTAPAERPQLQSPTQAAFQFQPAPQGVVAAAARFSNPPAPSGPVSAASTKPVRQVSGDSTAAPQAVIPADGFQPPIMVPTGTAAEPPKPAYKNSAGRVRISFFE
jgi:Tfp pilus assembly protein PilF